MEENVYVMIKHMKGDITLNQLSEICKGWASNDDATKAVWKWLQHLNQESQ